MTAEADQDIAERDRKVLLERCTMQAGPLMVRHVIDGHDVLLPADAKLHKPLKPGDAIDDGPLSRTY